MQHPWQPGSKLILIGGFQKGMTWPCNIRVIQSLRGGVVFFGLFTIAVQIQNCTRKNSYAIDQLSDQKRKFELNMSLINYFKFSLKMSSLRCVKDMIMISQFYFQLKKAKETTQTLLSFISIMAAQYWVFVISSSQHWIILNIFICHGLVSAQMAK